MIRLEIAREPRWIDLGHGVEALVAPMTTAVMLAARAEVVAGDAVEARSAEELGVDLSKAIACRLIRDWRGVGDADGAPIAPSAAAVEALIDLQPFYDAFTEKVLAPWWFLGEEKNGSAPSSNGISAGALTTAPPATDTAQTAPEFSTSRKAKTAG